MIFNYMCLDWCQLIKYLKWLLKNLASSESISYTDAVECLFMSEQLMAETDKYQVIYLHMLQL